MSTSDRPIPVVAAYFGPDATLVISHTFIVGRGWEQPTSVAPLTLARIRALKSAGVRSVALTLGGRTADFRISELLRKDRRLLLGSGPLSHR